MEGLGNEQQLAFSNSLVPPLGTASSTSTKFLKIAPGTSMELKKGSATFRKFHKFIGLLLGPRPETPLLL